MIRNRLFISLIILLILTVNIAVGVSGSKWTPVRSAEAGNNPFPDEPAIDNGTNSGLSMPTTPPKPGYQWVLKRTTTQETTIVPDGYRLERQPRYIEERVQTGWREKTVPVYRTVTENEGWEYYTVQVPVYKTVSYIKEYKNVAIFRNGVFVGAEKQPVFGSKRIQTGTRTETRRRPRWVTHEVFSHWKTVREPEYGWVTVQDGWEEPQLVSNYVSKSVPGSALTWQQEPIPWQPGTIPEWLPEPYWLADNERPPWISESLWYRLPLDDRQAILREARDAWEKMLEEQILSDGAIDQNMPRELFETLRLWEDLPKEMWVTSTDGIRVRKTPSADSGMQIDSLEYRKSDMEWTGKIHVEQENGRVWYQITYVSGGEAITGWVAGEYVARYVDSGKRGGEPEDPARETYGYHEGKEAWSHYLDPDSSAAQFLKLTYLFAAVGDLDYGRYTDEDYHPHYNLCGELAVMEAVGISLEEGLKRFRDYVSAAILRDPRATTTFNHLETFFEAFGWDSGYHRNDSNGTRLKEEISNGHSTLALVTIDDQGELNSKGTTPHWVGIKSIEDGEVQVYNPFTNKIEIYDWKNFSDAWANTPGNKYQYQFITAEQPDG